MVWIVTVIGAVFFLLGLIFIATAARNRRRAEPGAPLGGDTGVGNTAILMFLGFGLLALGLLLGILGVARLATPAVAALPGGPAASIAGPVSALFVRG